MSADTSGLALWCFWAALASCAAAVGCGEPGMMDAACTDWQCTRRVQVTSLNQTYHYCVRGLSEGSRCSTQTDCYHALDCTGAVNASTCTRAAATSSSLAGYLSVLVAALFFGSNYLPVRKMRSGNGVLFQFFMSLGIVTVGLVVQLIRQSCYFYPSAMLGGMLWAIGNCMSVRVINAIGVGMAVTTWGCSGMVFGWLSGRFGFWDMTPEEPSSEVLSVLSVVVAILAIVLFGFVKPGDDASTSDERSVMLNEVDTSKSPAPLASSRLPGFMLAVVCGIFNGFTFDPAQSMMDHYADRSLTEDVKYSPDGLDYAFSTFLGIFLTGLSYAALVAAFWRRFPFLEHSDVTHPMDMFVPAFVSGIMWAIAATAWFVANTNLGLAVSYPLVALGPCVVASLWGVLYLKEIRGRRNFLFLSAAFLVAALSCVFTVLSKR